MPVRILITSSGGGEDIGVRVIVLSEGLVEGDALAPGHTGEGLLDERRQILASGYVVKKFVAVVLVTPDVGLVKLGQRLKARQLVEGTPHVFRDPAAKIRPGHCLCNKITPATVRPHSKLGGLRRSHDIHAQEGTVTVARRNIQEADQKVAMGLVLVLVGIPATSGSSPR